MFYGDQRRTVFVLLVAFAVSACGAESPSSPTSSSSQSTDLITYPTGFGGAPTSCVDFNNAKAGPVSVFVTPPSMHVALRTGKCNAAGQVLAEKDTELINVAAPAGANNLVLSNAPASDITIRLTYWK
jgi:hypothetical protein